MIAVLVNPAAGRGRARAVAHGVIDALRSIDETVEFATEARGDEARLVTEAVARGARIIVIVGGDGSVHHAARGLLDAPARVPVAIVAAGTGNDFVKSLGTPAHDIQAMIARITRGHTRAVDVGLIDGVPFLNAAGLGFDVEVLERMLKPSRLSGTAAYVVTALRALLGYRGFDASLRARSVGEERIAHFTHLMTVFANGRCFGGAFRIAPEAVLDDGLLEVIDIGEVSWWKRPVLFLRATRGTHVTSPLVRTHFGRDFSLHCRLHGNTPPAFEADGELYRASSHVIEIGIRPRAIDFIV